MTHAHAAAVKNIKNAAEKTLEMNSKMKKRKRWVWIVIVVGAVLAFLYLLRMIGIWQFRTYTEVERHINSDGRVEAVVMSSNAGATTAYTHYVFVLPKGEQVSRKSISRRKRMLVFHVYRVYELEVKWTDVRALDITYKDADIFGFRNKIHPFDDDWDYVVNVRQRQFNAD
jgi:DNA-binding transcriptional regulator of glucitol operon